MPTFGTVCGHEKCETMARIAERVYNAAKDDAELKRLVELDNDLIDTHDAVWAILEHISGRLLADTMKDVFFKEWGGMSDN